LPQAPQLLESLSSVAHVPLQLDCPDGQPVLHAYVCPLAWHVGVAPLHGVPQAPQFVDVDRGVAHPVPVLPQSSKPAAHWYEQWPPEQPRPAVDTCESAEQALPQAPQLPTSVVRFTQVPPHNVVPVGQRHWPAWQVVPPLHAVHDAPQWAESVDASTQVVPQSVCGAGHAHAPDWHVCPPLQAWPQLPQFAPSLWRLVHAPPHRSGDVVVGHLHTPAVQVCAEAQAVAQAPQWVGSVMRLAQVPLQFVSGVVHVPEQA
jgi:hypothetical protein